MKLGPKSLTFSCNFNMSIIHNWSITYSLKFLTSTSTFKLRGSFNKLADSVHKISLNSLIENTYIFSLFPLMTHLYDFKLKYCILSLPRCISVIFQNFSCAILDKASFSYCMTVCNLRMDRPLNGTFLWYNYNSFPSFLKFEISSHHSL